MAEYRWDYKEICQDVEDENLEETTFSQNEKDSLHL